jgi:hypothetical protein
VEPEILLQEVTDLLFRVFIHSTLQAVVVVAVLVRPLLWLPLVEAAGQRLHQRALNLALQELLEVQEELPQALLLHLGLLLLALQEPAEAAVHTSLQSLAWPELLAVFLLVAVAADLLPTTASRLALAVLAAAARSTSSPIANL